MSRKTSWGHFVVFCINRNRIRAMILPVIPLPTLEPPLPTSSKDKCNSLKSRSHECKKTSLIDQLVLNQNSGYQFQPQMFLFFFWSFHQPAGALRFVSKEHFPSHHVGDARDATCHQSSHRWKLSGFNSADQILPLFGWDLLSWYLDSIQNLGCVINISIDQLMWYIINSKGIPRFP